MGLPRLPRAIVPRPEALEAAHARLAEAGSQHLQVIVDFDHTLTQFVLPDGRPAPMCHDVVEHSSFMPEAFREGYRQLWADQHAAHASGSQHWADWWDRSHKLMVEHGLKRRWLPEMVRDSGMRCRERCREFFDLARRYEVPVLIASAGITQVIQHVLELEGVQLDGRVRILANEMHFDEASGVLVGFSEPTLHAFAKASVGPREREYFARIGRKHAILAGDSLTDCDCLKNIAGLEESIRVGFFNARTRMGKLEQYKQAFDMLLSSEWVKEEGGDLCLSPLIELLQACSTDHPAELEPVHGVCLND